MPAFPEFLNTDGNGTETSAVYSGGAWKLPATIADGDDVTIGAKADAAATGTGTFSLIALAKARLAGIGFVADAAVSNPASSGSVIALLKGLLTLLGVGATAIGKAEDAAHASGDTGIMALTVRQDTAAALAGTTGDYQPMTTNSAGRARTITRDEEVDLSNARTTALAASLVVKASAGRLYGFQGYSTTAGFMQVHNTTSVPADTAVPVEVLPVEANKPFSFDAGVRGVAFSTGITVVFSSTGPTKTIGGAVTWISAQYE